MRSLTLKLSLAFVFVSLTAAILVAVFVQLQTEEQFDQFMLDRNQSEVMEELVAYYETTGSWRNIRAILMQDNIPPRNNNNAVGTGRRRQEAFWLTVTLVGLDNRVIVGGGAYETGQVLGKSDMDTAVPVEVSGAVVGYVIYPTRLFMTNAQSAPETRFLASVTRATIFSAIAGTSVALLIGLVFARTISRPVKELTRATQQVAQGQLEQEVTVNTRDELHELALSFNQMSRDLAEAKQSRQQMTADIAHDLRTPTTVILGYAEALHEGQLQGSPEIYSVLYQEAQTLTRLIDDLRLLSLADTGELTLNREPVAPAALLARVVLAFQNQAQEQGVTLTTAVSPDLPLLDVDPERMNQVLGNLVSNALRYTPTRGAVTLSAAVSPNANGRVILRVQDTGRGIAPADLPHIFNRFYRGDEARHPSGESGLGLAIVQSIVEVHGGDIRVDSQPDQGTTFTIALPAVA